jgi:site-specific DNA recombinase
MIVAMGDEKRRCAIYTRVSTEMQVDRQSLSTQDAQLREYAERHGWAVVKIFTDAGLSAKNTKRPALQEMLQWAKERKVDVILVSKIDRISRNLMDLLRLLDDLKAWGVDFVAASQSFDTSTPTGMLMLNMLGSFAQFERDMTAERVRENMRERAKSGAWSGGVTPFGYRWNSKARKLEVSPEEAQTIRAIFGAFRESRSVRRTIYTLNAARRFNRGGKPWARTTVRRILTNPIYIGTVRYAKRAVRGNRILKQAREKWIVTENACEPIVEKSLFEGIQASLNDNTRPRAWSEASEYLLTSMARCGICGGRLNGMTCKGGNGQPHKYYRCVTRIQKGPTVCAGVTCRAEELEEAVVGQIVGFDADTLRRALEEHKRRAAKEAKPLATRKAALEAEFESFRERERKLLELYEESVIDLGAFKERRGQLERQKLAISQELADLESRLPRGAGDDLDPAELAGRLQDLQATFPHLPLPEQQRLLRAMVRRIAVQPDGKVELDLNLLAGVGSAAVPIGGCREINLQPAAKAPETIGDRLKAYRQERQMRQKDLARLLGVGEYALCCWERGTRAPRPEMLARIEQTLIMATAEKVKAAS